MILSSDGLELKTKKQLIEILRTEIKFDTVEGTILKAPLYVIYLVYKFFSSLTVLPKHLNK